MGRWKREDTFQRSEWYVDSLIYLACEFWLSVNHLAIQNYTVRVALDQDDIDLRFLVHYVGRIDSKNELCFAYALAFTDRRRPSAFALDRQRTRRQRRCCSVREATHELAWCVQSLYAKGYRLLRLQACGTQLS
jgi:hypothetical protein